MAQTAPLKKSMSNTDLLISLRMNTGVAFNLIEDQVTAALETNSVTPDKLPKIREIRERLAAATANAMEMENRLNQ